MPSELPLLVEVALKAAVVLAVFLTMPLALGQLEHKVMGHMQGRLGPMEAGPHGILQLVADGIKFVQKEDVTPAAADRPVFRLAPAVALIPYLVALAVIPFGASWVAADVPGSLLLVLAVTSVGVIGTLMAGWGSGNKYSLLGGMRAGAQLVSYELPLVIAAASVAMAAGTLSLTGIVQEWSWWWLLWQAPAAFVFLAASVAELQRTPFDAPIADSEVVFGPLTEYTGLRFAFFLLAEYAGMVVMALLFTVLFLGGWRGPWADAEVVGVVGVVGVLWTLLKATAVGLVFLWLRVAWPRVREDQLQRFAWLVLLPVALLQLAVTGVGVVFLS
ncbi:NADH-quinone oxidoreductase subunit NuoH [Ornithinimicrobium sp. W1665]|uniref:NADH-quinone oxidoreductase subunit NuoH n=1 Tax=Ornithinimicrobium sp. W1665 TaxID=3416666 RepID=UPI003CF1A447